MDGGVREPYSPSYYVVLRSVMSRTMPQGNTERGTEERARG